MQFKDAIYGIGDFFEATFEILPALGNLPNNLFMFIGFVAFTYWMLQMRKHAKADKS